MVYVLYNTTAGAHYEIEKLNAKMNEIFPGEQAEFFDAISVEDKMSIVSMLSENDRLVIVGGDGTLNRFVNSIEEENMRFRYTVMRAVRVTTL